MKLAIYARVSTSDKEQDPETQLLPLREFAEAQVWEIYRTYIDMAPATDLAHRYAWRELLEDASKRRFDLLLVWRMDRAFRSVNPGTPDLTALTPCPVHSRLDPLPEDPSLQLGVGHCDVIEGFAER